MAEEITPLLPVEEQITNLKDKIAGLEVPSFGDDLIDEAKEAAQASLDVAMVAYNEQIATLETRVKSLENPEIAPLTEDGNEYGEEGPPVEEASLSDEVAPLTDGGNEYGEEGPPLDEAPVSVEIAPLTEGGNEYGEEGPPVSDESPDMVKED
jgi:hypothetical protein